MGARGHGPQSDRGSHDHHENVSEAAPPHDACNYRTSSPGHRLWSSGDTRGFEIPDSVVSFPCRAAGMGLYGALTIAAASYQYFPFDVPIERFIPIHQLGPLVPLFTRLDEIEGIRQQLLAVAGIVLSRL